MSENIEEVIERAVAAGVRAALSSRPDVSTRSASRAGMAGADVNSTCTTTANTLPLPSVSWLSASRRTRQPYARREPSRRTKSYTKDVVCLPPSRGNSFPIPRAEKRAGLAERGLIGKITFWSNWTDSQMKEEISSLFRSKFLLSEDEFLPFDFLHTIRGSKKLIPPNVSTSFQWGGQEVASICSNACLYIMALIQLPNQIDTSDDSDFEQPSIQTRRIRSGHRHDSETCQTSDSSSTRQETSTQDEETCSDVELLGSNHVTYTPIEFSDFVPFDLEQEAIEEALRRSLDNDGAHVPSMLRHNQLTKEEVMGLLRAHSEKVIVPPKRSIFISRSAVWRTAMQQFSRPSFSQKLGLLDVTFASDEQADEEDAADLGGPRREFFRLLRIAILRDSGVFQESPNGFIPRLNVSWVKTGLFKTVGQMMSTMIAQGGEPPCFLAPCVVDYMVTGDVQQVCATTNDIPDAQLRDCLEKIENSSTDEDLKESVQLCESWLSSVEGLPNPVTMENKQEFVKCATLYWVILQRQSSMMDQLVDGLMYYEVLPLIRSNMGMRSLLDYQENDVSSDVVASILKPSYSILGSNKRPKEEIMVVKFRDFLECIQNKELKERLAGRDMTEEEEAFITALRPGHILAFATGSSTVPAAGFIPSPKLVFVHDEKKFHPIAQTCSNELQLFVNDKMLANTDQFDYAFLTSVFSTI